MGLFKRNSKAADEVIDLREPEPEPGAPKPQWGSPVPCPSCDGRGFLDHIDPFRELMYLHCTECGDKYEVHRSAFAAEPDTSAPFEPFTSTS